MVPSDAGWHDFVGLMLVIVLATLQGRVDRAGAFWQIGWALPGTVLHEFAHLVVAALTGAQPAGFTIVPRRDPSCRSRWILGSVSIRKPGPLSALPSAMAPLGLVVVAYYLYLHWFAWFPKDLPHTVLRYVAVYVFSYSAVPSDQDVKIALSSPLGVAFYFCVGCAAWIFMVK